MTKPSFPNTPESIAAYQKILLDVLESYLRETAMQFMNNEIRKISKSLKCFQQRDKFFNWFEKYLEDKRYYFIQFMQPHI